MKEIKGSEEFLENVMNSKGNVVVKFFIRSCRACEMVNPILTQWEKEGVKVFTISGGLLVNRGLCMKYGVKFFPTLVSFKDGKVVNITVGSNIQKSVMIR